MSDDARVATMVRLFEADGPLKLSAIWDQLPARRLERRNGDLYLGGVSFGHGAHARALVALLLHPPPDPFAPDLPEGTATRRAWSPAERMRARRRRRGQGR